MKFGPVAVASAAGSIVAHTLRLPKYTIRKGTVLNGGDLAALAAAGYSEVVVATTEDGDLHEDETAERLAHAVAGEYLERRGAKTGRANLYAQKSGLALIDRGLIDQLNRIDPALTIATVDPFAPVAQGEMVATIKIIPYAAPRRAVEAAEHLCEPVKPLRVAPYRLKSVGVVATTLPSLRPSVMEKTRRVLDERLEKTGARVESELRVPHDAAAVAEALDELRASRSQVFVVFGASAVADRADVIPAAIERAGGEVFRVGMPVDPGNLLVLGDIGGTPVIGAPGCARSPRENGFDWVLQRLLAGLSVTAEDLTAMGVGGLLKEIPSRREPRRRADSDDS